MKKSERQTIRHFIDENYKHFNAAVLKDAALAYEKQIQSGNKMMVCLAGAMSTAELGISLAEMIKEDKVHIITCTGANLEEDIFNLVAHDYYERIPEYRQLTPDQEVKLRERGLNRVTDTCIPEHEAIRRIETAMLPLWKDNDQKNRSLFPYEYFYELIRNNSLKKFYQIDPKNSWMVAAAEKNLPIITPGWEDSTLGNIFASHVYDGSVKNVHIVRQGLEAMKFLIGWYLENTQNNGVGFFQIGGGIAGDFPICVVPLIRQDLQTPCKLWSYFCQISDSTTSFGSYSGAVPNEKITWEKLGPDTPRFVIESDATIVAPLIFNYVLAG
ncbi:MAG: deoxyhypusine synthase family protein [Deltaproteobacteria bacterium]|nr:deoxyhypusine synthase family protein [Deltaproteobacteria bacterium]